MSYHQKGNGGRLHYAYTQWSVLILLVVLLLACSDYNISSEEVSNSNEQSFDFDPLVDLASSRPLDAGQPFRLGYGYDLLSGERHVSCLDPNFEVVRRSFSSTQADFSVIDSKEELARKLNIEINAEASASYGVVSGSISSKTQILRESNISERTISGIMSFVHRANELTLEKRGSALSEASSTILGESAADFRLQCGDAYTQSVNIGAAAYLVINLESKSSDFRNNINTSNTIKATFAAFFSASTTVNISREQQQLLESFQVSMSCFSIGASAAACSQPTANFDGGDVNGISKYIDNVRSELANSIETRPELFVSVDEVLEEYPKPSGMEDVRRSEIFLDISSQAKVLGELLDREAKVYEICDIQRLPSCINVQVALTNQIRYCARQESWVDCDPSMSEIDRVLAKSTENRESVERIGKVTLWDHYRNGVPSGRAIELDFDRNSNDPSHLAPGQVYNLIDLGYPENIASSFQSTLGEGWQVRVFDQLEGQGNRCWIIRSADPRVFFFDGFNDRASSIRLEREGQFPVNCG